MICWDLNALYPDMEQWEADFAALDEAAARFRAEGVVLD